MSNAAILRLAPSAQGSAAATAPLRDFREPRADLNDKVVLVTGGTGSFGKALVRIVCREFKPRKLIVFSRDELKQYELAQAFPQELYPFMRYFIGDVRDVARLEMAMRGVDYVIHAAALKQVTTAEYNPFECIKTNVMGAENVVNAAIARGVKRVVALSTDKAANPINLYGASKLAADKIFCAAEAMAGDSGTRFSVVRYGNVLGSRGSVAPLFSRLVAEGAEDLPITDPRMTRFWITLDQGVNFVLSSLELMKGSEIFIPKIPSCRVADLATAMAPGLPHRIVGVRPGEKLHEVMAPEDDARCTVELSDRYVILPSADSRRRAQYLEEGAAAMPEGFSYCSDRNPEGLDARGLQALLTAAMAD